MAASYSSFLTSQFYHPVFNTALFDGPFRIYFSQDYETSALKIYHFLQVERRDLWNTFKKWTDETKKHIFILIYPDQDAVKIIFKNYETVPVCKKWTDGFVIGFDEMTMDADLDEVQSILEKLASDLKSKLAEKPNEI